MNVIIIIIIITIIHPDASLYRNGTCYKGTQWKRKKKERETDRQRDKQTDSQRDKQTDSEYEKLNKYRCGTKMRLDG